MAIVIRNFKPAGTVTIAATVATGRASLSADFLRKDVLLHNSGTTLAFFKFGGATVEAALTDTPLPGGAYVVVHAGDLTHIAAIMASGTATIYATTGEGI